MLSFIFCSMAAIVLTPLAGRYLFRKRVTRDVTTLLAWSKYSCGAAIVFEQAAQP